MKATELRIGNYLQGKEVVQVTAIHPNHNVSISGNLSRFVVEGDEPCLQPIPLTEEWLLKFGFEIDEIWDDGEVSEANYKLKVNCDEELYINIGLGIWQLGSDVHMCYTRNRDIQHVHQLQNLYFALTGEELSL